MLEPEMSAVALENCVYCLVLREGWSEGGPFPPSPWKGENFAQVAQSGVALYIHEFEAHFTHLDFK